MFQENKNENVYLKQIMYFYDSDEQTKEKKYCETQQKKPETM
jgi:hypothetical protein